VSIKLLCKLCIGFLGTLATGLVSAQAVEYKSLASWDAAVSDVTTYTILAPPTVSDGVVEPTPLTNPANDIAFGPGTFSTVSGYDGIIYNDNAYGGSAQYFSDDPGARGGDAAAVNVSFNASADVTALAFTIGTFYTGDSVSILVNGLSIAPVQLSSGAPASAFFGVTDTSGPITSITFSTPGGEMDVIGSYSTASAVATAPEIDAASATSAVTLLFGGLAALRARKRA
jgi:hypothetical protein